MIEVIYRVGIRGELDYVGAILDDDDDALVTAKQAEDLLGVTPNLIKQWVFRRKLAPISQVVRPYLYRLSDLERCLDARPKRKLAAAVAWPLAGP